MFLTSAVKCSPARLGLNQNRKVLSVLWTTSSDCRHRRVLDRNSFSKLVVVFWTLVHTTTNFWDPVPDCDLLNTSPFCRHVTRQHADLKTWHHRPSLFVLLSLSALTSSVQTTFLSVCLPSSACLFVLSALQEKVSAVFHYRVTPPTDSLARTVILFKSIWTCFTHKQINFSILVEDVVV